jgi:addiction module HigA family antidote
MHNPAHPGEVLREWIPEDMTITSATQALQVSRVTFSKILNGKAGISASMALRLSVWLSTSPDVWLGMQTQWDCGKLGSSPSLKLSHWTDWLHKAARQ